MEKKIYIGIDVGADGFISVYNGVEWEHFAMPKIGDKLDVSGLYKIFGIYGTLNYVGYKIHATIEDVHAIFGSSAKATFAFGYVAGLLEMALVANNIPFTKVQPKTWQKVMWQGVPIQKVSSSTGKTMVNNTKAISLVAAKRLFPNIDFRRTERCRTADDNKVDSVLLCEYGRRNF